MTFKVHHQYFGAGGIGAGEEVDRGAGVSGGFMGTHRSRRLSRGNAVRGTGDDAGEDTEDATEKQKEEADVELDSSNGVNNRDNNTKNSLLLNVGHHGKTKRLSFALPNQMSGKTPNKKSGNDVNIIVRVPQLELGLLDEVCHVSIRRKEQQRVKYYDSLNNHNNRTTCSFFFYS